MFVERSGNIDVIKRAMFDHRIGKSVLKVFEKELSAIFNGL